ncbi:hypothetical protein T12_8473 [Trichinella patagoniensis]|uniref:Uncharacterized protein n=1 Tax=Trichinella patagoniensis TaxID=990121 RepID=A0A0V0ZKE4_9BILA|nr:hypothetical protein T12_8473 [Trichinella patagoniensis]
MCHVNHYQEKRRFGAVNSYRCVMALDAHRDGLLDVAAGTEDLAWKYQTNVKTASNWFQSLHRGLETANAIV